MTINSLSDFNLPRVKTIPIKKLSGRIICPNSGSLKRIIQNTNSGFISPLAAWSKYCMDLDETIIKRKIKLTEAVYEKIDFRK
tara:strand:+ start:264 stop:512 length:249 start_codon:yes stop_codon:yes gene_type:complete